MPCFLKFVSFVLVVLCRLSSSYDFARSGSKNFDLRTVVLLIIGGSILIAIIILTGIVIGLYVKVSKVLIAAKELLCVNSHLAKDTQDHIIPVKAFTTDSCRALPCCDDCNVYANFDPLPPCSCATNEGL
nr:protein FAM24A [Oryctolagus cuniculus]